MGWGVGWWVGGGSPPLSGRVRGGIIGRGIDTENSDEWNPTRHYLLRRSADNSWQAESKQGYAEQGCLLP